MSYRDQLRAEKMHRRFHSVARIGAILALANALYLLRVEPLVSPPGDPWGVLLTWDCVLLFCLCGLMIMAARRYYRP